MKNTQHLPAWLRRWLEEGDDMLCPECGEEELETQDGYTICRACGWREKNPASLHPERYEST